MTDKWRERLRKDLESIKAGMLEKQEDTTGVDEVLIELDNLDPFNLGQLMRVNGLKRQANWLADGLYHQDRPYENERKLSPKQYKKKFGG